MSFPRAIGVLSLALLGGASKTSNAAPAATAMLPTEAEPMHYELALVLDAERHLLDGSGTIRWRNTSTEQVDELYFHLYMNAFKDENTQFMRGRSGGGRSGIPLRPEFGHIEVQSVVARELAVDVWRNRDAHSPGDSADTTDIRVPLPRSIPPGEALTLDVRWQVAVPEIIERTGRSRDYYFFGQFYPKLAKLEADGSWGHFPFQAQAEFYADFARYDVSIEAPARFVVAASGVSEPARAGERPTRRYHARWVHDFAWAAWPEFQRAERAIDGVVVELYYPPGYDEVATTTLDTVARILPRYSARYGRYPYPALSIVHPPSHAARSGGMEYPMLITTGGRWFSRWLTPFVQTVTAHELAHQWFYGIVANDERRFPFLDEGLASYAEDNETERLFGAASGADVAGLMVSASAYRRAIAAEYALNATIDQPASDFSSFRDLAALVYARTTVLLRTVGKVWGEPALEAALRDYATRHRFEHAEPSGLYAALERHLGAAVTEVIRRALHDRGTVDYSLDDFTAGPDPLGAGFVASAVVRRSGELAIPAKLRVYLESGSYEDHAIDQEHAIVQYRGREPAVGAMVDPELAIELDQNLLNNARRASPSFGVRLAERVWYWLGLAVAWLGP